MVLWADRLSAFCGSRALKQDELLALFLGVIATQSRRQRYPRIYLDNSTAPWGDRPLTRDRPNLRLLRLLGTSFLWILVAILMFFALSYI